MSRVIVHPTPVTNADNRIRIKTGRVMMVTTPVVSKVRSRSGTQTAVSQPPPTG